MKRRLIKVLMICVLISSLLIVSTFNNSVLAFPSDQNFESDGTPNGTTTCTINDIAFTSNNGGLVGVVGADTTTTLGETDATYYTGKVIINDANYSVAPTQFEFAATDTSNDFKLKSFYILGIVIGGSSSTVNIKGNNEGLPIVSVSEVDLTVSGTYGVGDASIIYSKSISTAAGEYGGLLTFGSAWVGIDTVLIDYNGSPVYIALDSLDFSEPDITPPTVTDANISLSGATGSGGAYKIGDTITATWNNTAGGDNNSDVSSVTVDFTPFGGGAAVAANNNAGTWTATYTMVTGVIDNTNLNVSVTATDNAGNTATTADTSNATVDNQAPTVTNAKISLSGANGTGGAYKTGDTVTATWDNTAGGDNNSDTISDVTINFTAFGGGAAVAASNNAGTWTATYTIVAGVIDSTNLNISVTATDNAGNTVTTADTSNVTVDNQAPTVTDAKISLSGSTGTGGAYKIGDTITATWNNTAGGDNNSDVSSVTVDFTPFGGGAAVAASNNAGTWTATYTIVAGVIDTTNLNVSVTATDNAGNAKTTADTSNATVDNQAPTVTDAKISLSGATGTGGVYKTGDTVTATWDNTAGGDNNSDTISDVTIDFTAFGGGAAVAATNNAGTWTATYTIVAGVIDTTNLNVSVTATDNAGNAKTTADTSNATVDNQAPTVTDAKISLSGATGTGGAYKTGDTVTVTWDNTAGGDNNSDTISDVTINFTAFGGGASVAATNNAGIWTATYNILAGAIDTTNLNVSVAATDIVGNTSTTADTSNAIVDNQAPTVTDERISLSGATGTGGAYKTGDTVTVTWDNTAGGDNNSDIISDVTINFTAFGGGAAVVANNNAGTWTATYTIVAGVIDTTNLNVDVTATDNAGNETTTADTSNVTVDNQAPIVTDAKISLSGATGTGGAYKTGDTVTATWDNTAGGDNNSDTISDVTINFTAFGGGAAIAANNNAGTWTATYTIVAGVIDNTNLNVSVTATDNDGNTATTADTSNATVDSISPTLTITSGATNPTNTSLAVTFTFSENVTGFTVDDITVVNGTANSFNSTNASSYTAVIIPTAQGVVTVDVAGGVAQDSVGNSNTAAVQLTRTYDSIAPAVDNANAQTVYNTSTHKLVLKITEAGGIATGTGSSAVDISKFTVKKGLDNITLTVGQSSIEITDSSTITITVSGTDLIAVKAFTGGEGIDSVDVAAGGITDTASNSNINDTGNTVTIDLPPSILSAERTDDTHITVTLSEGCTNINKANDGGFSVQENGSVISYAVNSIAQGADASHVVLSVANMGISAKEGVNVKYTAGGNGTVQDLTGNALADNAGVLASAWDTTSPTISSSTLALSNGYIDITFSEGVYGGNDGTTALTADKLSFTINDNGGTATNAIISSVTKSDNGALSGGETTIRVNITITTGIPNGQETIEIKPTNGSSIYDKAGNAVDALETTGAKALNDKTAPTIQSVSRTDDTHINVTLSEDCTNIAKINDGGFIVQETGAPATAYAVSKIEQGADASHVVLIVEDVGVSAKEGITVKYTAGVNGTVQDSAGNILATDAVGVAVAAWDNTPPTIQTATIPTNNKYIDITFNEGVYGAADGSTALTAAKLALTFTKTNSGSATNVVISSVKKNDNAVEASATALAGGETTIRVFLTVTGTPNGQEKIEIKPLDGASIYDKAGNVALASQTTGEKALANQTTPPPSSSPDPTPTPKPAPKEEKVIVIVNGKSEEAATAKTEKVADKTITTVTVDQNKVEEKLNQEITEGEQRAVVIPVNNKADIVIGVLTGQTVKNMEKKEAVLEIKTEDVTYTLPASQINIDNVSNQIGQTIELKDIKVNVSIAKSPDNAVKLVEDTANKNKYQLVVKPVDFEVTCTGGEKTIQVSKFNGYVERTVAIPDGIDPSRITTGIVLNADGTFSHVPTTIIQKDGKYYAKINSLTNSTYSVIWNSKEFNDVKGHWAEKAINDMGSRLVVSGIDDNTYSPDTEITRAEFAAIVVRALGLMRTGTGKDIFTDIKKSAWYYDAVSIAYEYGLIYGVGDGTFRPDEKISRRDAMVMVTNAMKIAEIDIQILPDEISTYIDDFEDSNKIASWAKKSVAICIREGVFVGYDNKLMPDSNITRAQSAAIVSRILINAGLIDTE